MKVERVRLPRKLNKNVSGGQLTEAGRLNPVGALAITLNIQPLHRVTMTLSEKDLPLGLHDLVEVYNQNGSVGIYRVAKITNTYRKERKLELSHGLDVFADSTFDSIEKYSGTVAGFLQKIVNAQTQTIGGVKYWQLGTVEDTHPWNQDIKYDNLLECLTDIAKTEEDYMFTFDQSSFPWTLNFVARDSTVLSEFRLNRNVENCQVALDDSELCTRLHLSVTTETEETVVDGDTTYHAGTKTSEGYYTYNDTEAQAFWGIVTKTAGINRKDVPTDAMLAAWVDAYFGRHNSPTLQITINGEELNRLTRESIDELFIGRICRVALPDYAAVFNERIVSVTYPDALRTPFRVKVNLANKRQTAEGSFSEIKQKTKRAGGSAGSAKTKADNNETEQEKQKIRYNLKVESDNKHFAVIGSEEWYDEMWGSQETLIGKYNVDFQITARKLSSAFSVTGVAVGEDGMPLTDPETGEYIFNGSGNTLSSQITQTASQISAEVTRATGAENTLSGRITTEADRITAEVTRAKGAEQTLAGRITVTENSITQEVTDRTNADNELSGRITTTAGEIRQEVSNATSAASIVASINNAGSSVIISADHINLEGYVTTGTLETAIAAIDDIVGDLTVHGALTVGGNLLAGSVDAESFSGYKVDGTSIGLGNAVNGFGTPTSSSGQISIPYTTLSGGSDTINFNIADTQFYQDGVSAAHTSGWNDARAKVDPPGQGTGTSFEVKVPSATEGDQQTYTFTIQKGATPASSGYASVALSGTVVGRISIGDWYTAGYNAGKPVSGTAGGRTSGVSALVHDFTITKGDGTTATLQINVSSIYSTARTGYTYGNFTAATVTLQGSAHASITPIGTEYKYTYTHLYKAGSATTYYNAGSSHTYYKGNGGYVVGRGTSVTVKPCGNAVRFKRHTSSETPTGTWYTINSSDYDLTYYVGGSDTTYYNGNGSSGYLRGDSVSVTEQGSSVSVTEQGATQWAYVSDSNGSVTRYAAGTAITGLYDAGASVSDTYYTKS